MPQYMANYTLLLRLFLIESFTDLTKHAQQSLYYIQE